MLKISSRDGNIARYMDADRALREAVDALIIPFQPADPHVVVQHMQDDEGESYFHVKILYDEDSQLGIDVDVLTWHAALASGMQRAAAAFPLGKKRTSAR